MANKPKYDVKKTILKGLEIFVYAGIGAVISWLSKLDPAPTITITISLLKMVQNWLKHK